MVGGCADCANENKFCTRHQKNEKKVYENPRFEGKHDTQEFRMAVYDARNKDMVIKINEKIHCPTCGARCVVGDQDYYEDWEDWIEYNWDYLVWVPGDQ